MSQLLLNAITYNITGLQIAFIDIDYQPKYEHTILIKPLSQYS